MSSQKSMVVSDLDGTLLMRGRPIHVDVVESLRDLGRRGILRVVATGRALHSCRKVLAADFPIDYLVFSSGAGIVDWKTQELLVFHNLTGDETREATQIFLDHQLDFMLHDPIPNAQAFLFHRTPRENLDFEARFELHRMYGRPFTPGMQDRVASQLLAICPEGDPFHPYEGVRRALPGLTVVRATSPLDGRSIWLEAFSAKASKSQGAQWLVDRHSIESRQVLAVGNDYNDWDLLRWAGASVVMSSSPEVLLKEFSSVPCEDAKGVSRAIAAWLD